MLDRGCPVFTSCGGRALPLDGSGVLAVGTARREHGLGPRSGVAAASPFEAVGDAGFDVSVTSPAEPEAGGSFTGAVESQAWRIVAGGRDLPANSAVALIR